MLHFFELSEIRLACTNTALLDEVFKNLRSLICFHECQRVNIFIIAIVVDAILE